MSIEPSTPHVPRQSGSEAASPERLRALQSLAALDLGADLDLQGLVCDPDDPDCAVDGAASADALPLSSSAAHEGTTHPAHPA